MNRERLKFLLHTIGGCFAYPLMIWALAKSVVEEVITGIARGKGFVCSVVSDPFCYLSSLATVSGFVGILIVGAFVAWSDLLTWKFNGERNQSGFIGFFRSDFLVERTWFAVPFALILVALAFAI